MAHPIEIVEVGPRDGLQSEPDVLATPTKLELIRRLVDAGVRRVEVASFVNPKRVPQMADAEAVMAGLPKRSDVQYVGLVLNRRGFDRALAAGCTEIGMVTAATDSFAQRNQGASIEETIAAWEEIAPLAREAGIRAQVTISVSFGCPFEGEVAPGARHRDRSPTRGFQAGRDRHRRHDRCGSPDSGHSARRAIVTSAERRAAALPLPQHTQHGSRQRIRSGDGRRAYIGFERRRNRRLSVRAERDRQRGDRGSVVHVVA